MFKTFGRLVFVPAFALSVLALSMTTPAQAQRDFEPLFDKFNLKAEFSWVRLSSDIRLDSEALGVGTTLSFESELGLGNSESVPSLDFEWQIKKRQRLAGRWQQIDRDSSAQALTEIQWGDEIIPIDAEVILAFDQAQFFVDYTYYPWVKERWAGGFGIGFRVVDLTTSLTWSDAITDDGGTEAADVTGPLPYLYFEYRRMLSQKWRFIAGLGWLQVTIGDISGGQWIGRGSFEYLIGKHWSVGASLNLAKLDVDWEGIKNDEGVGLLAASLDTSINDISIGARWRF